MTNADTREAFPPGTLVGERYRIIATLARGGFGVVYVAEQLATARRVALKLLTAHLYAISVDRLLAEARIASRVNSEHIVQVYDAGIDPESSLVFVAMELLSGSNLAELVRNRGAVSASETAEYLRQVALGLDRVHGVVDSDGRPAPIVHRDLKPANLFLTRREDGMAWIKILDFGAAKVLSDDAQVSSILRATPEYMAYEQAAGGEVTPGTDIWAFGLIAFYLLTGQAYWRGARTESGRAQIFGEVLTLPLVPASERARELGATAVLGPAFDNWFFRCVNRVPSERFASAGEAARALARALDVTVHPVPAPALDETLATMQAASSVGGSSLVSQALTGVAASSRKSAGTLRFPMIALLAVLLALNLAGALFLWFRTRSPEAARHEAHDAGASAALHARRLEPAPAPPAPPVNASSTSSSQGPALSPSASDASRIPAARSPLPHVRPVLPQASASASSTGAPRQRGNEDPYDVR